MFNYIWAVRSNSNFVSSVVARFVSKCDVSLWSFSICGSAAVLESCQCGSRKDAFTEDQFAANRHRPYVCVRESADSS